MGHQSSVQVIQRGGKNRQLYLICPAPLAQVLEIEKGELIDRMGGGGQACADLKACSWACGFIPKAEETA